MINGVLVERTVKDVVPALQTNAEGLKKVLDDLVKQYKTKQDELEKWKVRRRRSSSRQPSSHPRLRITVVCCASSDPLRRRKTTCRLFSLELVTAPMPFPPRGPGPSQEWLPCHQRTLQSVVDVCMRIFRCRGQQVSRAIRCHDARRRVIRFGAARV